MFTGLIETTGVITARTEHGEAGSLTVRPRRAFTDLQYGESIAVNGACLTLEQARADGLLVFHTLAETLRRTNLGLLPIGGNVNLERALRLSDRLGGHLVSGHIDAVGQVIELKAVGGDYELSVSAPEVLLPYLVEKGSVTIDGISLTLVKVTDDYFTVELIPVTLEETALRDRASGAAVNLEGDLLGKYVERQLQLAARGPRKGVTMDMLREAGW